MDARGVQYLNYDFYDLNEFNDCLETKLGWRIRSHNNHSKHMNHSSDNDGIKRNASGFQIGVRNDITYDVSELCLGPTLPLPYLSTG